MTPLLTGPFQAQPRRCTCPMASAWGRLIPCRRWRTQICGFPLTVSSIEFGKRCRRAGVSLSMGSRGDCYDDALCESFFATLEWELLQRSSFRTPIEARMAVFNFVEGFYNPHRRHSSPPCDNLSRDPGTDRRGPSVIAAWGVQTSWNRPPRACCNAAGRMASANRRQPRSRPKSQASHTARFDSGLLFTQSRSFVQAVTLDGVHAPSRS